MIMTGELGEWSVDDLLQIVRITEKTTTIEIDGPQRRGYLAFRQGRLVGGEVFPDGPTGGDHRSRLVESVYLLLTTAEGSFHFGTRPVPDDAESFDIKDIIESAGADLDRERRIVDAHIERGSVLELVSPGSDPVTIPAEVWGYVTSLVPAFGVSHLEAAYGRREAVVRLLALFDAGLLGIRHGAHHQVDTLPPVPTEDRFPVEERLPLDPVDDPASMTDDVDQLAPVEQPSAWWEATAREEPEPEAVEIFGPEDEGDMHEVLIPSDTTLVTGVLSDIRRRFRHPDL